MVKFNLIFLAVSLFTLVSCVDAEKSIPTSTEKEMKSVLGKQIVSVNEFGTHFSKERIDGSFIWYDLSKNKYYVSPQIELEKRHSPASTFKILNSLIALETRVIKDTNQIIKWDGVDRNWDKWNKDQTLASAVQYSALWAFREIARNVHSLDTNTYQNTLIETNYGNKRMSEEFDFFWLDNSLQISPMEQIDFLVNFYLEKLPFKKANIDLVKQILINKKKDTYQISGKTGWSVIDDQNVAWYVGYVEKGEKVYFFCTKIERQGVVKNKLNFRKKYLGITELIIEEMMNGKYESR